VTRDEEIDAAWLMHESGAWRNRGDLTPSVRSRLSEAQNWRCAYCGHRMDGEKNEADAPSFEHLLPRSRGGPDTISNVVIVHRRCNQIRGDTPLWAHIDRETA
jgi:5-methylcytosine-specific restriction endonuclease McrA